MSLNSKYKTRLRTNIIQCIIGIILLVAALAYLTGHEAEQTNLKSGLTGIKQKISILWDKYRTGQDSTLSEQFKLTQQMTELLKSFKLAHCEPQVDTTQLQKELDSIQKDTVAQFVQKQAQYLLITRQYYTLLNQSCK